MLAPGLEGWPAGARVLCIDYRQPVMLAKELATLDVLSGGRVDVAIGAGWNQPEYEAIGLPPSLTVWHQPRTPVVLGSPQPGEGAADRLNGVPVSVIMTVTVQFTLRQ